MTGGGVRWGVKYVTVAGIKGADQISRASLATAKGVLAPKDIMRVRVGLGDGNVTVAANGKGVSDEHPKSPARPWAQKVSPGEVSRSQAVLGIG